MARYRIGNDMTVVWSIYDHTGAAYNLKGKEVRLYYTCERGRFEVDFEIQGTNEVVWSFLGREQKVIGDYTLSLEIIESAGKRRIFKDYCNAFTLVGKSCEETALGNPNISEDGNIVLSSKLDVYKIQPIIPTVGSNSNWFVDGTDTGKPSTGKSAYEYAKEKGYEGTESEYAESLKLAPENSEKLAELSEEINNVESETTNLLFSVAGITLEDAGGALTYQKLHLDKGKTYIAELKEGAVARLYGKGNFDGYDDFGEVTNSKPLMFTPNYDIDRVAVYNSSAASKVVFSVEKGALEHRVTIAEDNIANAKLVDFTNQLSSIGYSIINESSTLAYYELPISLVGGNYQWRLVRGSGDVSVYSTEQKGGAFKEQGFVSSVGGFRKLDTTTPINYIGIYAPSSADGAEIVLETEGGSAKGLALLNKEEINNFVPIQNGQKAVLLSIKNGYIVAENGDFIAANTYSSTDYIQTTGVGKIKFPVYFSDAAGLAFYDKNKRYISGFKKTNEKYGSEIEIDVPFNADYVRVCYLNSMPNGDKFYMYLIANGDLLNANGINEKVYRLTPDNLTEEYIVYTNGDAISAASYRATGFIKVPNGRIKFPVYFSDAAGLAFYDHKKEYISGFGKTTESMGDIVEIEIPNSCQYIRICCIVQYADKLFLEYNGNIFDVVAEKDGDVNPCEYRDTSGCRTFNKILCIGDSLTQGTFEYTNAAGSLTYYNDDRYSYPTFLKAISGRNVTNAGTGGLTTKSWWEMHQNDDFSGHDACIIALGRNDYVEGRETTSEERFTYMANIINAVRAANPKIKVFVATMLNYYKGTGADAVNNDMRAIAEQNNCFLVDISRYGKIEQRDYSYSHLTATGYEKVANYYFNYISYIIANQPREFMNVQFVGTDYSFNS